AAHGARCLVARRGTHTLAMNFGDRPVDLPDGELVLSTHDIDGGALPPLAGAALYSGRERRSSPSSRGMKNPANAPMTPTAAPQPSAGHTGQK
ncbi:MAG: hypothetical protein M3370_04760, partial [Actinomycetota bacterium]|nr:hypothetical protein [Actinomycetota bacterium]